MAIVMNCHQVLEHLDAARPDGSDLGEPELIDARAHLAECPTCASEFQRRTAWDLQVMATEVELPAGLQARLIEQVAGSDELQDVAARVTPGRRRLSRRLWFASLGSTALVLVATAAWYFGSSSPGPATLQQLQDWPEEFLGSVDDLEALRALPEFVSVDGAVDFPAGWDPDWRLTGPARQLPDHERMAVMAFRIPTSRRGSVPGILLVAASSDIVDVPKVEDFATATPRYSASRRFSAAAWTNPKTGTVFVCLVAPGHHERLRRALEPRPV